MNNHKATKRALLTSVMALVMCVVMLVGTTFAWFTDTASTSVNTIKAGNLNVELLMQNSEGKWVSAENETLNFVKDAEGVAAGQTTILWEPGATYQLPELQIKNAGNLALKYKINVSGAKDADNDPNLDSLKLLDVLEWTYEVGGQAYALNSDKSLGVGKADTLVIKATMDKNANNDYQGMAIEGIAITVYATQDTVEYDSNGNTYDKDAAYAVYPAGVTEEIFASKADADYSIPGGSTGKAQAVAAYVDSNGEAQYTADIKTALDKGASTIYLKKDTKGRLMALTDFLAQANRTSDVTKDITIYANGADFEYGELAINTTDAGKNANFTIKIYDAKNIRVWGNTPNAGVTQNIILENCTYEGTGIGTNAAGGIFFAYGETGTINLTMNNCKVSGSDQGVYFGCDGSLTVKDSSFTECATGIKVSYKGAGTRADRIENCIFTKCGCTTEMAGSTSYLANDSAAIKYKTSGKGVITLTLKGNTITGTLGDKGDTQFDGVTPVKE